MATEIGIELAEEVAKQAVKEIEKDRSFAWELIANARRDSKRWFVALLVVLSMWLATIGGFLWYLNQYDFTGTTTTADSKDGGNAVINDGGDVNINGKSNQDNQKQN